MGFKDELYIKTHTNKYDKLTKSFYYYFNDIDKTRGIAVPKGFTTDYASIPLILSPLFPKMGRSRKAAVLHDWLYSKLCDVPLDRKQADNVFLNAMVILGEKRWRYCLMYIGVRLFGFLKYKKK